MEFPCFLPEWYHKKEFLEFETKQHVDILYKLTWFFRLWDAYVSSRTFGNIYFLHINWPLDLYFPEFITHAWVTIWVQSDDACRIDFMKDEMTIFDNLTNDVLFQGLVIY